MPATVFTLYWEQLGKLVHVRMFANAASCGQLVLREPQWEDFKRSFNDSRTAEIFIVPDEPRQIRNAKS